MMRNTHEHELLVQSDRRDLSLFKRNGARRFRGADKTHRRRVHSWERERLSGVVPCGLHDHSAEAVLLILRAICTSTSSFRAILPIFTSLLKYTPWVLDCLNVAPLVQCMTAMFQG